MRKLDRVLEVITSPWAIRPEMLVEIQNIYHARVEEKPLDIEAIEAELGRDLANEQKRYDVVDGTAVIEIDGVIGKKMNLFMEISGGASTQITGQDFQDALANDAVEQILLVVDSPGGMVDGTQELARMIYDARGTKPIIALAEDTMASAAYWIGAAADKVFLSSGTTQIGSIGIVATHYDYSKRIEKSDVTPTELTSGKYKRIASETKPLSKEGREYLQAQLDQVYSVFVNDIAMFRGVTPETVLEDMADGRTWIGQQGIDQGLADGFATRDMIIARAKEDLNTGNPFMATSQTTKEATMPEEVTKNEATTQPALTLQAVKENHPEIAQTLIEEGKTLGAEAERARIQGVRDASLPGYEAEIERMMFDGKTSPGDAALAVNKLEREAREKTLGALKAEAPDPVPVSEEEDTAEAGMSAEEKAQKEWAASEKLRAEFASAENYAAYKKGVKSGRIVVKKKS